MKHLTLFPHRWKIVALLLLALSIALFVANDRYDFEFGWLATHTNTNVANNNLTDEVWITGIIGSLLLLCFCRERVEDEYVESIRLHAWQWAIVVNYLLFIVANWTVYGVKFFGILMYNVLTPLLIYLLIFYCRLYILPLIKRKAFL